MTFFPRSERREEDIFPAPPGVAPDPSTDPAAGRDTKAISIEVAQANDVASMARLHAEFLPHGFFVELGPRFLRTFHRTFIHSPFGIAFVARGTSNERLGMIVGTTDNAAHYRWLLRKRWLPLAASGLASLLVRPRLGVRFFRTRVMRYLRGMRRNLAQERPSETSEKNGAVAVLAHVAVDPAARGRGVGAALVRRFEEAVRAAGTRKASLVTFAAEEGAGPFYEALGWHRTAERADHDGREIAYYERQFVDNA